MYKIKEGMLSWILHRTTGVAIVAYLIIHIWSMAKMSKGPEAFNAVIEAYKTTLFRAGEVLLLGAILFHGTNGLRCALELIQHNYNVAVLSKLHPVRSHTGSSQGGYKCGPRQR